jgi:hypothetical protein
MRSAGIAIVSCKSLFYEWARDLATTHRIVREYGLGPPEGLMLGATACAMAWRLKGIIETYYGVHKIT